MNFIEKLIKYFVGRTRLVNLITVLITVAGLVGLYFTKRDLHPPFQFNYVSVTAVLESASADEIERLITYPLEEALQGIPDVEEITSRSRTGSLRLTLKFPQKVKNISEKIEMIRGRVQVALRDLPPELRDLRVERSEDNQIFLANLGVTGIDPSRLEHHQFISFLSSKMKSIKGIVKVDSSLPAMQIFVRFNPKKIADYGLTVVQLKNALRTELDPRPIGYNSVNGREWLLEFSEGDITPDRIKNIPIFKNNLGQKLSLGDVAQVSYDFERSEKYHFLLNGKPAVEIEVQKSPEGDSIAVFAELKKVLADIEKPPGIDVAVLYDGPYFINQQIQVLLSNGFGGLILVLLMLAFAMGWKTSLMTALGLPISYFGTFIVLKYLGMSIDLISLIGMILVVGNLVDDAVIFAERYNQLLTEGVHPEEASTKAASELIIPVSGTILTIICAFVPIVMIDSELSIIFMAIPIVVATALLLSWFETFFILPNHLAHYVKVPPHERSLNFFNKLARGYKKILSHTLKWRYGYGLLSIVLLVGSLYVASQMPQNFSLNINAPQVEIFAIFKDEKPYDQIQKDLSELHNDLLTIPKTQLDFLETNLGLVYRENKMFRGPRYATIRLVLNREEQNVTALKKSVLEQAKAILQKHQVPGIESINIEETERGAGSRREHIASVQIEGKDENSFPLAKRDVIEQLAGKGKVGPYSPPDNHGPMTYQFVPAIDQLRLYELSKSDLAFQIQAQSGSVELLRGRESGRWLKVMLEPEKFAEPALADLKNVKIQSPKHGEELPLKFLGEWKQVGYSDAIEHKESVRSLVLDFKFDGTSTNEKVVQQEIKALLAPIQEKYKTLKISSVDANEADKKGREWTGKIVLLAAVLIYFILAIALQSFTQPLIVGLPIPFALIGVIWALKLHGMSLGLMSMIGLIGTMGVAVNDSIVMVDHINRLWREAGKKTKELIIEGAATRIRAICLTASCTLLGVFPTAYGIGGESGFTQPLAFSMGWGLSASLMLTLFIIPAMLMVLEDIQRVSGRWFEKIKGKKKQPSLDINTMKDAQL